MWIPGSLPGGLQTDAEDHVPWGGEFLRLPGFSGQVPWAAGGSAGKVFLGRIFELVPKPRWFFGKPNFMNGVLQVFKK
jgi:hypothetical protein